MLELSLSEVSAAQSINGSKNWQNLPRQPVFACKTTFLVKDIYVKGNIDKILHVTEWEGGPALFYRITDFSILDFVFELKTCEKKQQY